MKIKVAYISEYFSDGMGYSENCLPQALERLGCEVRVFSSDLQVYGLNKDYRKIYEKFLGPPKVKPGDYNYSGTKVTRLKHIRFYKYVYMAGLKKTILRFNPHIIQFNSPIPLNLINMFYLKYPIIFTECHQHKSVAVPLEQWQNSPKQYLNFVWYRLSRTLLGKILSNKISKCFAISQDCALIANSHYGIPKYKIVQLPLGTDTYLFHPIKSNNERQKRIDIRKSWGIDEGYIAAIYTGRLTIEKKPLLLAEAIDLLSKEGYKIIGIFVGDGIQSKLIKAKNNCKVIPFIKHTSLADIYRAADIGVWPAQESMSMLDAMATGLPIIVSDKMGDVGRISNSGLTYKEDDVFSLKEAIKSLFDNNIRIGLGINARKKAEKIYSWDAIASKLLDYYLADLAKKKHIYEYYR